MKVFVLEDCRTAWRRAERILQKMHHVVLHRESAKAARGLCGLVDFDLYIIDVGIPATACGGEADGLEFIRRLRDKRPDARVIVWSESDRSAEAAALGAAFVRKGDDEAFVRAVKGGDGG